MRISDWSSDVCSSDLADRRGHALDDAQRIYPRLWTAQLIVERDGDDGHQRSAERHQPMGPKSRVIALEFAVEPECKPHQRRDTEAQQYLDVDRFAPQGVIEFHQKIGRASCRERV